MYKKFFYFFTSISLPLFSVLQALRPQYPIYDTINFQMKGYDYTVLERYQKFVHKIAESMDIEVTDRFVELLLDKYFLIMLLIFNQKLYSA